MNTPPSRINVLHSIPVWLEQTLTWLYTQVNHLPADVESHVACVRTANLDQFGLPNIHVLVTAEPAWQRIMQKWLRFLKIRTYSHLLEQTVRQHDIRLLHSHFGNIGWQNLPIAQKYDLRHVVTFYGRDVTHLPQADPAWRDRYQELFANARRILCEGHHMAGEVIRLGCPADKVQVHHLGVDVENIAFQPCLWQSGTPLRVLMAASFREKKGLPYAIAALGRLQKDVPLEITLIGDATSTPDSQREKQKILAAIDKHNLPVNRLGFQPYHRLMQEAYRHHVFLSPSVVAEDGDTEGGAPVSLIDMAACGLMIVSTTHCDIPEIVLDKQTGLLADERDVDGLVERLRWLVAHPQRWEAMLQAGRNHIEAEYNARLQGQRLAATYREISDG